MNATRLRAFDEHLLSLDDARHILSGHGFSLSDKQPYISGERFLMAKHKLVLAGTEHKTGKAAVIKISNTRLGRKEIATEKKARDFLLSASFAKKTIVFPEELYYSDDGSVTIWAIAFIEQERVFVDHVLEEQFFLALRSFEAQEAFHATTFEHASAIAPIFPTFNSDAYLASFEKCIQTVRDETNDDPSMIDPLLHARALFAANKALVDRYDRFLTHSDFVPHNFRIKKREMYMLDCAAVHFGNKYDGWARFLNYMYIHNPKLETLLTTYLRANRGEEEYLALRLMRLYKVVFLMAYYARSLKETSGDLHTLTELRLYFWRDILVHLLDDKVPDESLITTYKQKRNALRSPEEIERQKDLSAL